jgi:hypothetical protein
LPDNKKQTIYQGRVGQKAAQAYLTNVDRLAASINRALTREPDLDRLIGVNPYRSCMTTTATTPPSWPT